MVIVMKTARLKQRDTNIELYRCIVMLLIVAHHYMMHSGLLNLTPYCLTSSKSVYLYFIGMWGKIGINCFVLITGYYMCLSTISYNKFLKLLLQVEFYKCLFFFFFLFVGKDSFSIESLFLSILPFTDIDNGFVDCFFLFYLFIPFLNILIHSMNYKQHFMLVLLCLFVFCLWPQFHLFRVNSNYVVWFCIIYFVAAFIRKYKIDEIFSYRLWGAFSFFMIVLALISVLILLYNGRNWPYLHVYDCNSLFAVSVSVLSFMFFKRLPMQYNKWVNVIGGTTFGILLIHDCSWNMRHWLWVDVCNCIGWFDKNVYLHSLLCVCGVFVVGSIIDYLRFCFFEKPLIKIKSLVSLKII